MWPPMPLVSGSRVKLSELEAITIETSGNRVFLYLATSSLEYPSDSPLVDASGLVFLNDLVEINLGGPDRIPVELAEAGCFKNKQSTN